MKLIQKQMNEISKKHLFQEKILIVPSHSAGRSLLDLAVFNGLNILNLRLASLDELAEENLNLANKELLNKDLAKEFFLGQVEKIRETEKLSYYKDLKLNSSFYHNIFDSIEELKMASSTIDQLNESAFLVKEKANDLKILWQAYEKAMEEEKYIDRGQAYSLAIERARAQEKNIYIVPSNMKLSNLERKLLEILSAGKYIELDMGQDEDLDLKTEDLELFKAYGQVNEVRQTLAKIKEDKVPFDQIAIYYSSQEPYSHLFYSLSQELDLDISFGQGIDILYTKAGQLFSWTLEWLRRDFEINHLLDAFHNSIIKIDDENISDMAIASILEKSGLSRGLEQYSQYEKNLKEEMSLLQAKEDQVSYKEKKRLESLSWIESNLLDLMKEFPESHQDLYEFSKLLDWLNKWMEAFTLSQNRFDGDGKVRITSHLSQLSSITRHKANIDDLLKRIEDQFKSIKVGGSLPEEGKLHIDNYRKAAWIRRPHAYFIGLDADKFPGIFIEDSVLLDKERRSLDQALELRSAQSRNKLKDMILSMNSISRKICLSYSSFNTIDNSSVNPTAIFLQVARKAYKNDQLSYEELAEVLDQEKGFIADELDQVLNQEALSLYFLNESFDAAQVPIEEFYPETAWGIENFQDKLQIKMLELEDKADEEEGEILLSSSQMETFTACPYRYFLSYILGIRSKERRELSPFQWLDPLEKGSLYHLIYEKFEKEIINEEDKGISLSYEGGRELLEEITNQALEEAKKNKMPTSHLAYRLFQEDLLSDMEIFLDLRKEKLYPASHLELSFGFDKDTNPKYLLGKRGKKSYYLRGLIDRVEDREEGLRIWDYKTGSSYGYSTANPFDGARKLQHALYGLAMKNIMPNKALKEGGYLFPTVRGQGEIVDYNYGDDNYWARTDKIVEFVLDKLKEKKFPYTDNIDRDCRFCEYKDACYGHLEEQTEEEKEERQRHMEDLREIK